MQMKGTGTALPNHFDHEHDELTDAIIGAAIEVHRALGPGLLESAYEACMVHGLALRGLRVRSQVPVPVVYKGIGLDCGYRIDLLVNDEVVVELKAIDALAPVHEAQLLSYMKLAGKRRGLLINFNVPLLKQGIKRRVL